MNSPNLFVISSAKEFDTFESLKLHEQTVRRLLQAQAKKSLAARAPGGTHLGSNNLGNIPSHASYL